MQKFTRWLAVVVSCLLATAQAWSATETVEIIKVTLTGQSTATVSGTIGGSASLYNMGKSSPYKLNKDGAYVSATLETGYFQAGDVVTTDLSKKVEIYYGTPTSGTKMGVTGAPSSGVITYTLPDDFPANVNTIYIYRSSSTYNGSLTYLSVSREVVTCNNPEITVQPTGAEYSEGETINALKVTATGSDLTYQWYSMLLEDGTETTAISGATSATYGPSLSVGEKLYYYCLIKSGDCSTISDTVSVYLKASEKPASTLPIITAQPAGGTYCAGSVTALSVTASPVTSYQWYKDGSAIDGATNQTYTPTESGDYYVIVSNLDDADHKASTATSGTVSVTVNPATAITTQPVAANVLLDDELTLSVEATGTNLTYQWYKDGTAISGATAATYTVAAAAKADAGSYKVIVSGDCGTAVTSNEVAVTVSKSTTPTTLFSITGITSGSNVSCAIGETVDLKSYSTITGGTAVMWNNHASKAQTVVKKNTGAQFSAGTVAMIITPEKALKAGDIITVTAGGEVCFTTTNARSDTYITSSYTYTLDDAFDGATTLYVWRGDNSTSMTLSALTITRPVQHPSITKFVVGGVEATIDQDAKTITASGLPYSTDLTNLTPTVTLGGSATDYTPAGAQDFTTARTYTVSDAGEDVQYTVSVTKAATASDVATLASISVGGQELTINGSGNTFNATIEAATKTFGATQAVTFTFDNAGASANFTNGASHDFSTGDLTITTTAEDGTTHATYVISMKTYGKYFVYLWDGTPSDGLYTILSNYADTKNYHLSVHNVATEMNATTMAADYDLVILGENPKSANATALQVGAAIGSVPVLNFKSFMFGKSNWPTGTPTNGGSSIAVRVRKPGHPIFKNITLEDDTLLTLLDGSCAGKGIQGLSDYDESSYRSAAYDAGTGYAAIIEDAGQNGKNKSITITLSTEENNNLTTDVETLIENTIDYLLTNDYYVSSNAELQRIRIPGEAKDEALAPGTDATHANPTWWQVHLWYGYGTNKLDATPVDLDSEIGTPDVSALDADGFGDITIKVTAEDGTTSKTHTLRILTREQATGLSTLAADGIRLEGNVIRNTNGLTIDLFDAAGRLMRTTGNDIDLTQLPAAIYFVRANGKVVKVMK
ncbi:MAG: hypothetical protein IJ680_00350 [Paludibacteraceae bacterium]|nr:hypothetical protein [Paludibacteraceae bacterium]